MPRRRTAKTSKVFQWCSARRDNKEWGFVQLGNSLFEQQAEKDKDGRVQYLPNPFHALSPMARWTYLCLCSAAKGKPEVLFTKTDAERYGIPTTSFRRAVKELEDKAFLTINHAGRTHQPNLYKFLSNWKKY